MVLDSPSLGPGAEVEAEGLAGPSSELLGPNAAGLHVATSFPSCALTGATPSCQHEGAQAQKGGLPPSLSSGELT